MAQIRKAKMADGPEIQKLVNYFAERDEMLPKSLVNIYENIRDFFIMEEDGKVIGCCALQVAWEDLAEIRSLAVDETVHRSGLGTQLVNACLEEARQLGITKIFALTYKPEFFLKLGFSMVEKNAFPQKIWSDCINCPKFPDCGEEAVQLVLS